MSSLMVSTKETISAEAAVKAPKDFLLAAKSITDDTKEMIASGTDKTRLLTAARKLDLDTQSVIKLFFYFFIYI